VLAGEGHAEMDLTSGEGLILGSPLQSLHVVHIAEPLGVEERFGYGLWDTKT